MTGSETGELEIAIFTPNRVITSTLREDAEVTIGRDEACDLRIQDASVSRRHAKLRRVGAAIEVTDLGSANGTFVREGAPPVDNVTLRIQPISRTTLAAVGTLLHFGTVPAVVRRAVAEDSASIVVREPAMQGVYERAYLAAGSLISVLLLGETGVGKEVLARAIHERSPRAKKQFMALNCAALAPSLIESELFGHEKGAFTGAPHAKAGLFESANGGTVFLDEIGELPPEIQVKLLRVLEDRTILSVGGRTPRAIDVRILSATHRDLEAACKAETFREDLYFRLAGMSLTLPPLRERGGEILELASLFLKRACLSAGRDTPPTLSDEVIDLLRRHTWPGNVRELRNAMELTAVLCTGDRARAEHLPDRVRRPAPAHPAPGQESSESEKARILDALARCDGNQTRAAEMLGISRRTLVSRLGEYGMTKARKLPT